MTVPEVRALLVYLLDTRVWDLDEILGWSHWRMARNRHAAASHRKRCAAERRQACEVGRETLRCSTRTGYVVRTQAILPLRDQLSRYESIIAEGHAAAINCSRAGKCLLVVKFVVLLLLYAQPITECFPTRMPGRSRS